MSENDKAAQRGFGPVTQEPLVAFTSPHPSAELPACMLCCAWPQGTEPSSRWQLTALPGGRYQRAPCALGCSYTLLRDAAVQLAQCRTLLAAGESKAGAVEGRGVGVGCLSLVVVHGGHLGTKTHG